MPAQLTTYSASIPVVSPGAPVETRTPVTPPAVGEHVLDRDALDDPHPEPSGALGQRDGDVDGVDPAVAGDVEAGQQVVGLRPGEQVGHLPRRDLLDLQPEVPLERGDPAVLLQAGLVGGRLDEADRLEAGGLAGLLLEPRVEVTGVQPDRGRGLRRRPEAGHQARGVPRGAGGEAVALEQDHVGPAGMGEVVGDGAADHAPADDDDAGTVGELSPGRGGHRPNLLGVGDADAPATGSPALI